MKRCKLVKWGNTTWGPTRSLKGVGQRTCSRRCRSHRRATQCPRPPGPHALIDAPSRWAPFCLQQVGGSQPYEGALIPRGLCLFCWQAHPSLAPLTGTGLPWPAAPWGRGQPPVRSGATRGPAGRGRPPAAACPPGPACTWPTCRTSSWRPAAIRGAATWQRSQYTQFGGLRVIWCPFCETKEWEGYK